MAGLLSENVNMWHQRLLCWLLLWEQQPLKCFIFIWLPPQCFPSLSFFLWVCVREVRQIGRKWVGGCVWFSQGVCLSCACGDSQTESWWSVCDLFNRRKSNAHGNDLWGRCCSHRDWQIQKKKKPHSLLLDAGHFNCTMFWLSSLSQV